MNSFGPTTELEPAEPETPDMEFEMELEEAISMMSSDDDVVPEQFSLLLSSLMSKATDEGKVMMVENLAKIFNDNQNQKENRKPKTNLLNVSLCHVSNENSRPGLESHQIINVFSLLLLLLSSHF